MMRKKAYRGAEGKVTAVVEEELEEARLGRYMGMKKPEMELLFGKVKRKDMRIAIINELARESKTSGRPFNELVKKLIEEREGLR